MLPFDRSAAVYDLLYEDLDTVAEVDELLTRLPGVRSILDLGCGTGRHAAELARRGIEVVGVDRSAAMVGRARARGIDARVADLSAVRLGRTFDAVIAMFHVFAYATTDEALESFVATARAHLAEGGRLFFDTWSAAAVRASPPEMREKVLPGVTRRAFPTVRGDLVEVRYEYLLPDERFEETHVVRPWIPGDLRGFRVRAIEPSAGYGISVLAEAI